MQNLRGSGGGGGGGLGVGGGGGGGGVRCWWVGNKVHYGKCKVAY